MFKISTPLKKPSAMILYIVFEESLSDFKNNNKLAKISSPFSKKIKILSFKILGFGGH